MASDLVRVNCAESEFEGAVFEFLSLRRLAEMDKQEAEASKVGVPVHRLLSKRTSRLLR